MKLFSKILIILGLLSFGIKLFYYNCYSNFLGLISIFGLCVYFNIKKKETGKYYGNVFFNTVLIYIGIYFILSSIQDYNELRKNGVITKAYIQKTYTTNRGQSRKAIVVFINDKGLYVKPSVDVTMIYKVTSNTNIWIKYSKNVNSNLIFSYSKDLLKDINFIKYIWYYVSIFSQMFFVLGFISLIYLPLVIGKMKKIKSST